MLYHSFCHSLRVTRIFVVFRSAARLLVSVFTRLKTQLIRTREEHGVMMRLFTSHHLNPTINPLLLPRSNLASIARLQEQLEHVQEQAICAELALEEQRENAAEQRHTLTQVKSGGARVKSGC